LPTLKSPSMHIFLDIIEVIVIDASGLNKELLGYARVCRWWWAFSLFNSLC
jgi:hypothetical protein